MAEDITKVNSEYGTEQIDSLEGLEAVRRRPGMYIGSTSQRGVTHLIWEVLDNSMDENVAGYGDTIHLTVKKDCTVIVEDHGRGIPVGPHHKWKNPDGTAMNTLTGILTKLHAGGKFNGKDSGYKVSGGLHGVGAKCTNALSDLFIATVKRDGNIYQQKFSKGKPTTEVEIIGNCDKEDTGTIIQYHPDKEIFKQTLEPSDASTQSRLDEIASLNAKLKIIYKNEIENVDKEFYYENGIIGYTKRLAKDKTLLFEEPFYCKDNYKLNEDKSIIVEVAFIYDDNDKPHETFKTFANNINTYEGGYHLQGFRDVYKKCMNEYIQKNNISKNNIELRYLLDGIYATISVKVPEAQFEGQTKTKLGNEEVKEAVENIFEKSFNNTFSKNSKVLSLIAERAVKVKDAEEAARKARAAARKANKAARTALPGKLTDCGNKNGYKEVIICEGDSAGGAVKQGRFSKFQAVLPLRGKVMNTEKSDFEKMLKSEAIRNIIATAGTGIGAKFDIKKNRYDKYIIMTDADVDGSHIRTLLLTLFYNYMRPLLEEGYIYIALPPLYRVIMKGKSQYLQDDNELKEFRKKHSKFDLQRFKGLGEMDYTQLKETVLDPEKRTLLKVTLEDAKIASETFDMLMGKDAIKRRDFIEDNAHLVNLNFL